MADVHIVFAHPSERSFTREVLAAFLGGLDDAGHTCTVSESRAAVKAGHLARAAEIARSI
jgi:NAD(P)H dehydrogenase (quinone)